MKNIVLLLALLSTPALADTSVIEKEVEIQAITCETTLLRAGRYWRWCPRGQVVIEVDDWNTRPGSLRVVCARIETTCKADPESK